jgi:uncharacterized membrane protein
MTMHDRHDSDRDWEPGHALLRLVFFSDAVFAIAITLLVIDLHAPAIKAGSPDEVYWQAIADLFPNLVAFIVSFFVIGAFWAGHHRAFDCARHWSPRIVMPNLFMLMAIAAMPFFSAFIANNPGMRVPSMLYCFWLLVTGLLNVRLQRVVTAPPVVAEDISSEHIAMLRRRGLAVVAGSTTALIVAIFVPWLALLALISIGFWRRGLDYWAQRKTRSATA